jgi:hypothetical protein
MVMEAEETKLTDIHKDKTQKMITTVKAHL